MDDEIDRRTVLRAVGSLGAGATVGLAGCSDLVESPPDETPTVDRPADDEPADGEPGGDEYVAARTPPVEEIPEGGIGKNFELVGHDPLLDEHQYDGESFGIPRGSNGDITVAGDCVYVGSFVGYQPPLIVDVSEPTDPEVVGPVPDAVPGVGNGVEGIEANGDVLVIDQRRPLGGLGFDVPEGMPDRGLAVYDVSTPHEPELVARHDYGDLNTHSLSLWRDPEEPERLLAVQTFDPGQRPHVKVIDLTGCPDDCEPSVVAEWDFVSLFGRDTPPHDAIVSTNGKRIYAAQYAGVSVLDSSNLVTALRDGADCDPSPPGSVPGEDHCLAVADPDLEENLDAQPELRGEWQHTAVKVPDRPYLLVTAESAGPDWNDEAEEVRKGTCPGGRVRLFALDDAGRVLDPEPVGTYGVPEQEEHSDAETWAADEVAEPAWLSPHLPLAFPDLAFATYYSAGVRAIDVSDPADPVEAGHYFNEPVEEVRWASYGMQGDPEYDDGGLVRQPTAAGTHMFAFSYPVVHDGHVVYADVHSGLYVLTYTGPHADQLPDEGICHPASPGHADPGYEPCPPYGETGYGGR